MSIEKTCVAIGFFDSFHLGHKAVIDTLLHVSTEENLTAKVITLFNENSFVHTTEAEKNYLLKNAGITNITPLKYSEELHLKKVLTDYNAKVIVVGKNFHLLNIDLSKLESIAQSIGAAVKTCDTVFFNGNEITMNLVQKTLENNDLDKYTKICGHPFTMLGTIVKGRQIGRSVGMPTANLSFDANKILPKLGVYSTVSHFDDEKFMGMTNIGMRPTVDNDERITVETFILDFDRMVYDKTCILEVHFFIRDVIKFNSLQEVQEQVQKDVLASRKKLSDIFN